MRHELTQRVVRLDPEIAGDELVADANGEPKLEADQVRERCDRLAARDLLNLNSAYKAISESGGGAADPVLVEEMSKLAASRAALAAPRFLSDLAINRTQQALYSQYRLCSAVVCDP